MSTLVVSEPTTDPLAKELLLSHREAIVVYLDKDDEGECTVATFTKLADDNALSNILADILQQLLLVRDGKGDCHKGKATTDP